MHLFQISLFFFFFFFFKITQSLTTYLPMFSPVLFVAERIQNRKNIKETKFIVSFRFSVFISFQFYFIVSFVFACCGCCSLNRGYVSLLASLVLLHFFSFYCVCLSAFQLVTQVGYDYQPYHVAQRSYICCVAVVVSSTISMFLVL